MTVALPLRVGVVGLGRAFMLMLPTFLAHPRVRLVAACDPRNEARTQFARDFAGASTYADVNALCADPAVDAVYISTPHEFHAEHVQIAAQHSKHVLVEKPMALTVSECMAMNAAAARAGITLLVGHSHSFDLPFLRTREMIASGTYGAVRMITALNYTDFLYRPRRPEELDTAKGGGVVFSQGAHQVDVVRLLAGGRTQSVQAHTGAWDRTRPTEGAYSAQLTFDSGAFGTLVYSGYGHFDSDEWVGWISETGYRKDPAHYASARAKRREAMSADEEVELKRQRTYGMAAVNPVAPVAHNQFGMVLASCEQADLRPLATGVMVYDNARAWLKELPPPAVPRSEVLDEFCDVIAGLRPPLHTGEWALATLEVCLAIVRSAQSGRAIMLEHQVGVPQ